MRSAMLPVALGQPGRPAGPVPSGEVHAWLVRLDSQQARISWPGVLSQAERSRARRFASSADGARFAAARAGLRLILAGYLGAAPAELPLRASGNGRPELAGGAGDGLDFSLSHAGDVALVAVSGKPAGADIEALAARSGLSDVVRTRFRPAEAGRVTAGCCGSPLRSFYRHWTAKEAYLKLTGLGLAGLRRTEFDCGAAVGSRRSGSGVSPGGAVSPQEMAAPAVWFDGRPMAGLVVSELDVSPGHVATVVAGRPVTSFRLLRN